jgi:TonB-dependent starch-binding outer membrane protein SusC
VGNQEIGLYSFATNLRNVDVVVGNQLITAFAPDNISNPNVKWESSVQENIGLDLGFFANKVELTIDLYNKISKDMLLPAILPSTAGGLNPPFINIGKMKNSGLEVTLNTQNLTGNFSWKTSSNISFNRNIVQDLGSTGELTGIIQRVPVTKTVEGKPIGQYFGHKKIGIFKTADEVGEAPFHEIGTRAGDIRFADLNNDNVINDLDKTFIGSPHPDFTANLINEFSLGNFDMNIFFRGVYGNEVYNMLRRDLAGTGAWHNQSVDIINRWSPTNLEGTEPRSNGNDPNQNRRVSDRFVEDGSYIRLQNFALGYNLSKTINAKYKITGLRFYVSGQNLWTLTKYSGYDPEIGAFNQSPLINGVDNGRFPVARSITFGANLNF